MTQPWGSVRLRRHYVHTKARGDMGDIARNDRDRTTERIELGLRAWEAVHRPTLLTDPIRPPLGAWYPCCAAFTCSCVTA